MAMLEIKDLEVYYGVIQAIKGVSFEVNEGEVIALIGANGAGKSNLVSFLEMVSYMMTRGLRGYVAKQGGTQPLLHFGAKRTEQLQGKLTINDEDDDDEEYTYSFTLERAASDQLFSPGRCWTIKKEKKKIGIDLTLV